MLVQKLVKDNDEAGSDDDITSQLSVEDLEFVGFASMFIGGNSVVSQPRPYNEPYEIQFKR